VNEPTTPVLDPPPDLMAEPTEEETQIEFINYYADLKAGRLDEALAAVPPNHFISYYQGRIVGHDSDPDALRDRVAQELGIHWARPAMLSPRVWP
jgi:hypothetical protein